PTAAAEQHCGQGARLRLAAVPHHRRHPRRHRHPAVPAIPRARPAGRAGPGEPARVPGMNQGYALVTGASSGLGLAIAEALARRGHNLILVARQREALESVACELGQRFGIEALLRVCDLSEPLQLTGLLQELEQGERRIDLLVNNAGIGSAGLFVEQDWSREQELIELNVLALARLCHALGADMKRRGRGQILNVASLAAFQPGPLMSNYFASK